MKRAVLVVCLVFAACVDPQSAEKSFCEARPALCAGADAGRVDAGVDAGCPRSDDFDSTVWHECWTNQYPMASFPTARLQNGSLVFEQVSGLSWSRRTTGSLLRQEISGNFVAEVRARLVMNGTTPGIFSAAVLIAVDPANPDLNSRLVSVGVLDDAADGGRDLGVLSEVTSDGDSLYRVNPTGSTEAILRLCRVDGSWLAFSRDVDGGTLSGFGVVGDGGVQLPPTVWVGPAAYNLNGPTVRAEHDWFRLSTDVTRLEDCGRELP